MSLHVFCASLVAAVALIGGASSVVAAAAHRPPSEPRAARDPANGAAHVPPLNYRSPFAAHVDLGAAEVAPWRATNETVGRIGGWRAYAREAAGREPARGDSPAAKPPGHEQRHDAAPVPTPR